MSAVYGCDGCRSTLGATGCPTHGNRTFSTGSGRSPGLYELEREVCNCLAFSFGYGTEHTATCPVHEARRQWIARRIAQMEPQP